MNNRELAVVLWTAGFLLFAIVKWPGVRRAMGGAARAALDWRLVVLALGVAGYLSALLYVGSLVGIWSDGLVSDTALWCMVTGLALYAGAFASPSAKHAPKRILAGAIGLAVFMEVVVNFYVFPLPIELLLIPLLASLAAMSAFTERDPEHAQVSSLIEGLLAAIGVVALAYVALRVALDWASFDWQLAWQQLALPVWLTLGALPVLAAGNLMRSRDLV
jgi:hypothetical protein